MPQKRTDKTVVLCDRFVSEGTLFTHAHLFNEIEQGIKMNKKFCKLWVVEPEIYCLLVDKLYNTKEAAKRTTAPMHLICCISEQKNAVIHPIISSVFLQRRSLNVLLRVQPKPTTKLSKIITKISSITTRDIMQITFILSYAFLLKRIFMNRFSIKEQIT